MTDRRKIKFKGPLAVKRAKVAELGHVEIPVLGRERTFFDLFDSSPVFRGLLGAVAAFLLFVFLCFVLGCSTAKPIQLKNSAVAPVQVAEAPQVPVHPTPQATPQGWPSHYVVAKGDSLWAITKKGGNPLLWPLIWKANRDQIVDPDWIDPGMELTIPYGVPATEIEWAMDLAEERPAAPQPRSMVGR